MVTKEQVLTALGQLKDDKLNKSAIELNLIRDVMVKEGRISLTFVISEDNDEEKGLLRHAVDECLRPLGIVDAHIRFRLITEHEKTEIAKKVQSAQHDHVGEQKTRTQAQIQASSKPALLQPDCKTHFIAIASGKGGVGKSTVTVNLAVALARLGKRVGIIDADIYGFSVPDMMGIEEHPQMVDNTIVPVERFNVKVISMGFFVEDNAPIIWRGPMLGKMLKNFFAEVTWGELDYLLLDLPPGTGDVALDVHSMLPASKEILVTTPHATAAFVAARAGSMARHTNHEILGVIENMAYYECASCGSKDYVFGRGGGAKLAEDMNVELLAQIPLGAPDNHRAEQDYSPSVYKAETTAGKLYLGIAERVIQQIEG